MSKVALLLIVFIESNVLNLKKIKFNFFFFFIELFKKKFRNKFNIYEQVAKRSNALG